MTQRYPTLSIILHWLIALGIFVCFPLGLYMADLKLSPTKLQLISYHKWLGVTIFALLVIRVLWRVTHTVPTLPNQMPKWQIAASHLTHVALYLLMMAIPVSGWLMSSAKGFTTVYFGIFPLPDLLEKNKEIADLLESTHALLNYVLLAFVVLHIAGALKHHFIDKDNLINRMLIKK